MDLSCIVLGSRYFHPHVDNEITKKGSKNKKEQPRQGMSSKYFIYMYGNAMMKSFTMYSLIPINKKRSR
jgi:hypothetical protein